MATQYSVIRRLWYYEGKGTTLVGNTISVLRQNLFNVLRSNTLNKYNNNKFLLSKKIPLGIFFGERITVLRYKTPLRGVASPQGN